MQLSVKGKQLDVGDALRTHIEESLSVILNKYFGDALEVDVTLTKDAYLYRATVVAHVSKGIRLEANGEAGEPYPAFDLAAERLSKRLRRHKRKLRDHKPEGGREAINAQHYILAGEADHSDDAEEELDTAPLVVAEMPTEIPTMSVSIAVMRLDLEDLPAMLFHNSSHGGLNMIYRRADGNIGWVDPAESKA
ncbi:ribosome hibernation-promoting factor, HPF/YfiA family [Kiloniella sp. b19]|uniref:ribosome hibernation-promoting factor, HPF/YfiA family n=1 Tax=Kiloniella sp. GXU_MW_B19 TaxID=3141326 RepID=UPI0031E037C1